MIHKHSQLKVIVPRNNVAIPNGVAVGGVTVAAGSRLYNFTTDAFNIPVGSFGFYMPFADSNNHQEVTGSTPTVIKAIHRRDTSFDRSPLFERHLEESQWISASCMQGVNISFTPTRRASNNIILAGAPVATANQIPVLSEFNYRIQVTADGDRVDLLNGMYNHPTSFGSYATPDYTNSTLTQNQRLDTIICNLVSDFNMQSNLKSVAFAVSFNGGVAGGTTIAAAAALPVGTRLVIGYALTGETIGIKITKGIQQALLNMATALGAQAATAQIRPYLLPGTTPLPAGVAVAGTTAGTAVADPGGRLLSIHRSPSRPCGLHRPG